jgi:hypothetical protein
MGVPYPYLTWEKLSRMYSHGVTNLAQMGGAFPPEKVPFNPNHETVRAFQYNPAGDGENEIHNIALRWAGEKNADLLTEAWKLTEKAILGFPNISSLYSALGFTWYRLWIRPLVPDYEALTAEQRAYYEEFMCTTPHNPNNVDLGRDVLFTIVNAEKAAKDVLRIDENVWKFIDEAIEILENADCEDAPEVIHDQVLRIKALRCWIMTNRNVAGWVSAVHGFMATNDGIKRESCRASLRSLIEMEIKNSWSLLELLGDDVEFMAMTDKGETPLVHGTNIKENIHKRIRLMQEHMDDEPYIDPDYIQRMAGMLMK